MATEKPLSLRRQRGAAQTPRSGHTNVANIQVEVFVDNGIFHLDEPYSYSVREELRGEINVGTIVWVPFNNQKVLGVVKAISSGSASGLKFVDSIALSPGFTPSLLELVEALKNRYVTSRFDLFRFMLPPLSKGKSKSSNDSSVSSSNTGSKAKKVARKTARSFVLADVGISSIDIAVSTLKRDSTKRRLIIVPTVRDLTSMRRKLLSAEISEFVELGSHLKSSERREAFARLSDENVNLVIGTRGAIFAPWAGIEEIVVVDDFSPHHYEIKSPYWNTRDVALLRSEIENAAIVFVGQSLSLELLRLVDSGWIKLISQANFFSRTKRQKVVTEPDSYRSTVKEGLKHGPVLISVVEKSYSNVFSCERCRTIAKCECGGRVVIQKKGLFGCTICEKSSGNWACQECSYSKFRTMRIGAERIHDDIGRMFPGLPILISTAEKPLIDELAKRSIVISTFGVEPEFSGGYGAIVLLGGEDLVNRPFIRSEEETLHRFFKLLGKLSSHGLIYSSLPAQNGISQAIIQQNPIKRLRAESQERHASDLPPHTRFVRIHGDALSMPGLRRKIDDEFGKKLASYISIDGTSITLKIQHEYSSEVLASLRALQKLRSLKKKALLGIHVDPYDI